MKKKILSLIMVLCLVLPCGILLTACGKDKESKMSNEEKASAYKDVATKTWSKIGVTNPLAGLASYTSADNSDEDKIEVTINGIDNNSLQFKITANNMATVLYLVGSLYENSGFKLTDGIVKFTATATVGGESRSYDFTLKPKLNIEKNKVYLEAYTVVGENSIEYNKIDADYDFDKSELKAFTVDSYTYTKVDTQVSEVWTRVTLTSEGKAELQYTEDSTKTFSQEITTNKTNFVNAAKDIKKLDVNFNATIQTYFNLTLNILSLIQVQSK